MHVTSTRFSGSKSRGTITRGSARSVAESGEMVSKLYKRAVFQGVVNAVSETGILTVRVVAADAPVFGSLPEFLMDMTRDSFPEEQRSEVGIGTVFTIATSNDPSEKPQVAIRGYSRESVQS